MVNTTIGRLERSLVKKTAEGLKILNFISHQRQTQKAIQKELL